MVHSVYSAALEGLEARPVRVEVAVRRGTPMIGIVGLVPSAARECRERIRSAAAHLGLRVPGLRITVNLSPADIRKHGAAFDLPVAVAVLVAAGHVPPDRASRWALAGELGLDGRLRTIRGTLPMALCCRDERSIGGLIVPAGNAAEALPVRGLRLVGAKDLGEVLGFLRGEVRLPRPDRPRPTGDSTGFAPDLSEIAGHGAAKRALEIAAAGGHNVLLRGPPGAGKSMLARAFPAILPPLTFREAMEATAIHSVAGQIPEGGGLLEGRPFRSPHHTVTTVGLIGGGVPVRPGEISLAHRGVLFADELPEFRSTALEALRQPLEEGVVHVRRAGHAHSFPARFVFIGAMNPCPCGLLVHPERRCTCDTHEVHRYRARISGPLLDRIDLHVDVPAIGWPSLRTAPAEQESPVIRARVRAARKFAGRRGSVAGRNNADLTPRELRTACRLDRTGDSLLRAASVRYGLSARGCHRVLRVARSIADLAGARDLNEDHVVEALGYRVPGRSPPE